MNKEKVLANLQHLHALISTTAPARIDLKYFTFPTECGTLHCTLGWAATDPFFNAQGLELKNGFAPCIWNDCAFGFGRLDHLFGPNSYGVLFQRASSGIYDEEVENLVFTDKELALFRIQKQISLING